MSHIKLTPDDLITLLQGGIVDRVGGPSIRIGFYTLVKHRKAVERCLKILRDVSAKTKDQAAQGPIH